MYDVMIVCDCGCEKTEPVQQPGQVPMGWIGVTWPERVVNIAQPGKAMTPPGAPPGMPIGPQGQSGPVVRQVTMVFSSWRCVNKHVKAQLTGQDKTDGK